ncbi:MAG TPA: hypothetical protein ENI23_14300 [bacterium]|nr:hypothetical protein [bacterium]
MKVYLLEFPRTIDLPGLVGNQYVRKIRISVNAESFEELGTDLNFGKMKKPITQFRFIVDKRSGNLIIWPALEALHNQIARGVNSDPIKGAVTSSNKMITWNEFKGIDEWLESEQGLASKEKTQHIFPDYEHEKRQLI